MSNLTACVGIVPVCLRVGVVPVCLRVRADMYMSCKYIVTILVGCILVDGPHTPERRGEANKPAGGSL